MKEYGALDKVQRREMSIIFSQES